jgi:hypothetical protein
LYLEKGGGDKIHVLKAIKKTMTRNNYYSIHLNSDKSLDRKSNECLGKLRATNGDRDQYVLYDSADKKERKEHGAFNFKYEMCNVGNIRKLKVILPNLEMD